MSNNKSNNMSNNNISNNNSAKPSYDPNYYAQLAATYYANSNYYNQFQENQSNTGSSSSKEQSTSVANMTQEQYYNYYANYYNYYNQYYNYYNATAPPPPTDPPIPPPPDSDEKDKQADKKENIKEASDNCVSEKIESKDIIINSTNTTPNCAASTPDPMPETVKHGLPPPPPPVHYPQPYPQPQLNMPPPTFYQPNFYYPQNYDSTVPNTPQPRALPNTTPQPVTHNVPQMKPLNKTPRKSRFQTGSTSQATTSTASESTKPNSNTTTTPTKPTNSTNKNQIWPETLKKYVQRAFNSVSDEFKDTMQNLLKAKLELVYSKDKVNEIDWDNEPLPLIPELQKKPKPTTLYSTARPEDNKKFGHQSASTYIPNTTSDNQHRYIPARAINPRHNYIQSNFSRNHTPSRSRSRSRTKSNSKSVSRSRSRSKSSPRPSGPRSNYRRKRSRSSTVSRSSSSNSRQSSTSYDSKNRINNKKSRFNNVDARSNTDNDNFYVDPWPKPRKSFERQMSQTSNQNEGSFTSTNRIENQPNPTSNIKITVPNNKRQFVSKRQQRKDQFQQKQKQKQNQPGGAAPQFEPCIVNTEKLAHRASRFKEHLNSSGLEADTSIGNVNAEDSVDGQEWSIDRGGSTVVDTSTTLTEDAPIVGTCQQLEKRYLRLTRAPLPSEVRPQSVLTRALTHAHSLWYEQHLDYRHVCEQLKSIRQDLTVQCIRNDFTLRVYKMHATIALESSDHEEFNQCQSQIKLLYEEGIACPDHLEFTAYRLLYYMYTRDFLNINTTLATLPAPPYTEPALDFAVKLRAAWSVNDYWRFFRLVCYQTPPKLCTNILKWFLNRERKAAFKSIAKAYRPNLELDYMCQLLGFIGEDSRDQLIKFINENIGTKTNTKNTESETQAEITLPDNMLIVGDESVGDKIDMKILFSNLHI